LFHQKCFACGISRGIQHLIHFDFKAAASYNYLSFIVLPVLIFGLGEELWRTYRKIVALKKADT
jgi:hypothetical protein